MNDTKEIKTSAGHIVILKGFLAYGDIEPILEKEDLSNIKKSSEFVRAALISIDGVTENVFEKLSAFPFPEYMEVAKEVTKLVTGDLAAAK